MKNKILLSICIPTYNRAKNLENCLKSIYISKRKLSKKFNFEVNVSDNSQNNLSRHYALKYKKFLNINYSKNKKNIGYAPNYLKLVSKSKGKFIWFLGDDDMLLPNSLNIIQFLINKKHNQVDLFYVNSINTPKKNVKDGRIIKKNNLKIFSQYKKNIKLKFFELINPEISFDYLLGMYLIVYKRSLAQNKIQEILKQNKKKIHTKGTWSTFENTCIQCIIYSKAFSKSYAYFYKNPLTATIHGYREWSPMYYFIEAVRIPEILDLYKSDGLGLFKYYRAKNTILKNFLYCFYKIITGKKENGYTYLDWKKHFFNNLIFPNIYLYGLKHILIKIFKKTKSFFYEKYN